MEQEQLRKIIWEMGTSGVENWEIIKRLKEIYKIKMTEKKLEKFIRDNFRR